MKPWMIDYIEEKLPSGLILATDPSAPNTSDATAIDWWNTLSTTANTFGIQSLTGPLTVQAMKEQFLNAPMPMVEMPMTQEPPKLLGTKSMFHGMPVLGSYGKWIPCMDDSVRPEHGGKSIHDRDFDEFERRLGETALGRWSKEVDG